MACPGGSGSKESAHNLGDLGLILGLEISAGEGNGYPLQYSGLENSMGWQRVRYDLVTLTHTLGDREGQGSSREESDTT